MAVSRNWKRRLMTSNSLPSNSPAFQARLRTLVFAGDKIGWFGCLEGLEGLEGPKIWNMTNMVNLGSNPRVRFEVPLLGVRIFSLFIP